jgi:CPA2 family monovalent cation:H+ antiporter-2
VLSDSGTTRLLAELGVAFLLFTLGLEFSLPRMLAMRREVFGLGSAQVIATAGVFALIGYLLAIPWLVAIVLGGAVAMSSTALLLQQLTERAELNRTHGRLAFSMLLFQDLAFVPFLALASVLIASRDHFLLSGSLAAALGAALAIVAVLAAGCCGRCFTRSRTAGCGSCSRSRCCWWCCPPRGCRTSRDCRSRSVHSSPA